MKNHWFETVKHCKFHQSSLLNSFPKTLTVAPGTNLPTIQWLLGVSFPRVKQVGRKADLSPPPSAKVKNEWSYTSSPPTYLYGMYKESFICTLPLPATLCYWIAKKSQYSFLAKHVDLYVQLSAVHSVQQHTGCTIDTDSVATHHFKVSKCTTEHGIHTKEHRVSMGKFICNLKHSTLLHCYQTLVHPKHKENYKSLTCHLKPSVSTSTPSILSLTSIYICIYMYTHIKLHYLAL